MKRHQEKYIVDRRNGMSAEAVLKIVITSLTALLLLGLGKWIDNVERRADVLAAKLDNMQAIDTAKAERIVAVEADQRNYNTQMREVKEKLECLRISIDNLRRDILESKSSEGDNGNGNGKKS